MLNNWINDLQIISQNWCKISTVQCRMILGHASRYRMSASNWVYGSWHRLWLCIIPSSVEAYLKQMVRQLWFLGGPFSAGLQNKETLVYRLTLLPNTNLLFSLFLAQIFRHIASIVSRPTDFMHSIFSIKWTGTAMIYLLPILSCQLSRLVWIMY